MLSQYDRDIFLQLSKTEVEEDIEDIRLTCARFSTCLVNLIINHFKSKCTSNTNENPKKKIRLHNCRSQELPLKMTKISFEQVWNCQVCEDSTSHQIDCTKGTKWYYYHSERYRCR